MVNYTSGAGRKGGRQKEFEERFVLSLSTQMLTDIDRLKAEDEHRREFIRTAIERELKRRAKARSPKAG